MGDTTFSLAPIHLGPLHVTVLCLQPCPLPIRHLLQSWLQVGLGALRPHLGWGLGVEKGRAWSQAAGASNLQPV